MNIEIQKRAIPLGAGLWTTRFAVVWDGRVKEFCVERADAERLVQTIRSNWEEKE